MSDQLHASAPTGHKCADCTMDGEPCPICYAAWWEKRHPNVRFHPPINAFVAATISRANLIAWADKIDNRIGPISGRDADCLALLLRTLARHLTALERDRAPGGEG
jgi:hypothetical protein